MAKFLGEGSVTAAGQEWHLRFDMNVLADLEETTKTKAVALLAELDGGDPSMKVLRQVCHAMLHRHHPEAPVTVAGDILSEDMDGFMAILSAAMPAEGEMKPGNGAPKAVVRQ